MKKILTKKQLAEFKKLADLIVKHDGSVDCMLARGSLDCSCNAVALEEATGESCYTEIPWDKETVKRLAKTANWDYVNNNCAFQARKFLELCAELNLSIRFSW